MMVIKFSVHNQRLRRITSGLIPSNAYGEVKFEFDFRTDDWNDAENKTAVFVCRGINHHEPLDENNMCYVPKEVLHEGYFLVSIQDGYKFFTNEIRVPVTDIKDEFPIDPDDYYWHKFVYVPTIDDNGVLSWTIQKMTNNMPIPDPVDLNIADEWIDEIIENEDEQEGEA